MGKSSSSRKTDRPVGTDYVNMLFLILWNFMETGFLETILQWQDNCNVREHSGHGDRSGEGKDDERKCDTQFCDDVSGRISENITIDPAGRKVRTSGDLYRRYPGAFCGQEAEEHGQGEAIASNLYELSSIKSSDRFGTRSGKAEAEEHWLWLWQMKCGFWKTLSIRFFLRKDLQSILWKDSKRASEAAEVMKLTADDLKCLGIVEQVIREPKSYTSQTMAGVCEELKTCSAFLKKYGSMDERQLPESSI